MRGPWGTLHNEELDFRGATARPGRRYLYVHYITTLLRMYRMKKPGWQLMVKERKQKKVWASPGKWYQESTLKHLARYVADEADAAGLFSESLSSSAPAVPRDVGESMSMAIAHEDEEGIEKTMRHYINRHGQSPNNRPSAQHALCLVRGAIVYSTLDLEIQ